MYTQRNDYGYQGQYPGKNPLIATLNKISGENQKALTDLLTMIRDEDHKFKKGEFEKLVSVILMALPPMLADGLKTQYKILILLDRVPEKTLKFRLALFDAGTAYIYSLQKHASDLSLRASASKHKDDTILTMGNETEAI